MREPLGRANEVSCGVIDKSVDLSELLLGSAQYIFDLFIFPDVGGECENSSTRFLAKFFGCFLRSHLLCGW